MKTGTLKGGNDIIREGVHLPGIICNNVDSSLPNQIDRVIRPELLAMFEFVYGNLLLIRFLDAHTYTHKANASTVLSGWSRTWA